jgi:hypothetical protein
MPWWQWLADGAGLCLLLLILYAAALLVRRRLLTRAGGTFEVSLRTHSEHPGRGWVLGMGRYAGDAIEVFRLFSLRMRPLRSLDRAGIEVVGQRDPEGMEVYSLYAGHRVVELRSGGQPVCLAMAPDAVTGMLAWLEAAPPGRQPRSV